MNVSLCGWLHSFIYVGGRGSDAGSPRARVALSFAISAARSAIEGRLIIIIQDSRGAVLSKTARWKLHTCLEKIEPGSGVSGSQSRTRGVHAVCDFYYLSFSEGGANGKWRQGLAACKQWGCLMDANLIYPRLERYQHVNTPDRGGCKAIIYKHAHRPFTSANKLFFFTIINFLYGSMAWCSFLFTLLITMKNPTYTQWLEYTFVLWHNCPGAIMKEKGLLKRMKFLKKKNVP